VGYRCVVRSEESGEGKCQRGKYVQVQQWYSYIINLSLSKKSYIFLN